MATHLRFERLMDLALYALRNLFRPSRNAAAQPAYLAYSIGPEILAVAVQELNARNDEDALQEATPLFNEGLKRVEVWCGSRKVGEFPLRSDEKTDKERIRNSGWPPLAPRTT